METRQIDEQRERGRVAILRGFGVGDTRVNTDTCVFEVVVPVQLIHFVFHSE